MLNLNNAGAVNIDAFLLTLAGGGSTVNTGTINVGSGVTGALQVSASHNINNTGGVISVTNGSVINQFGSTITGGTINTTGTGKLVASASAANFLSGVTLNGRLDMATGAGIERITNGLTLGGTIDINNNSVLTFEGNNTLAGTGTIVLGNTGGSNRIGLDGTGTTTFAAGTTVRGENGTIGNAVFVGGTQTLVNNGTISADVSGGTITISTAPVTNNGTLSALNGGTLVLSSNVTGNPGGQIVAGAGSTVLQNSVTLAGTINTSGTGRFAATASAGNILNGVTLNGNLDLATATGFERVTAGGLVLNGTINVNNNSVLAFEGVGGLSGNGTIVLGSTGGSNRIALDDNGTTTFAAGTTVRGENGTIGNSVFVGGVQTLVNNGTINADVAGGLITITGSPLVNNGLVRAQAGTMTVSTVLTGTGTLQVDATGAMNLAAGAKSQGTLAMGAAGAALNLNTGNLTLSNDYTNVGANSGNFFNRRAGVTGTGQIVAGGNAAQAITGANVTNGNTANATLTIGNVRVGNNTFDYQVANTGTTGPTLRGAIQTNVNGANLTDARLTGAGVTPSNYNAGAPGGNSGNLAVTFSAASAGALAPLAGQVLNLRSNFENIADQKLNIVLGAGAAAYNAAIGSAGSPVTVVNQRIGGSNTTALIIANTAAPGAFSEDLNVSVGAMIGATGSGAITGRLAGTNNTGAGAINVGVSTAAAGAQSGTVTLNYQTAGAVAGTSNGLGTASAGSQVVTVNGNVYQVAQPTPALPANVILGNFRAGAGPQSQSFNITNTNVAPAGFQESLNANISSAVNASGVGFVGVAAGASGAVQVGLNAINAGVNSGTVQVQFQSNGTGTSGLGNLNLGGVQTVNVTGTGYRLATANAQPATINFGNVLQNSAQAQFLNIQNTAIADVFSERLDASFLAGGTTGDATNNGGVVTLLSAGVSNNAAMSVGVSTATIGAKNGQVIVAFDSNGLATSGLGITALPNQNIGILANVQANVGTLAQPSAVAPNPVNFGNFRVSAPGAGPQNLTISNLAVVGEGLNASIATGSAGFTAAGAFNNLAPGATNNASLQVSFNGTGTAGAKSGTATVTLISDGTFNGGTPTVLPSQTVNMNANVFNVAQPAGLPATVNVGSFRTSGSPVTQNVTLSNTNISPAGFQEGLNATIASTGGAASASGALNNVAAGSSGSLQIGVTGVAGLNTGTVQVQLATNGAGTSGLGILNLGGLQTVNVTGLGYTTAQATVQPNVSFGIVHVGDVVATQGVSVQNSAPVTALNDTLRATIGGATGPFTSSGGPVAGLTAGGAADNTTLRVGLNTGAAGVYNGTATLGLTSQNPDMADLTLVAQAIALNGQVNNYANGALRKNSGVGGFNAAGSVYTLDLGTLFHNTGLQGANLGALNDVLGPSDLLDGRFELTDAMDFGVSGFNPFFDLDAGQSVDNLLTSLDTSILGSFQDVYLVHLFGHNASGFREALGDLTLILRGNVIDFNGTVPEPGTLLLMLIALAGLGAARRRKVH